MREKSAQHWAIDLTKILNASHGECRFPVNVEQLAKDYSKTIDPNSPIIDVKGDDLPNFEGCLKKAIGASGWFIIYNSEILSKGRINFTIAHEFGHYLAHRHEYPDGIQCTSDDMRNWGGKYDQIEKEANEFATTLLMPRDDFDKQISSDSLPNSADIMACGKRYGVSFTAAAMRWLQLTNKRAIFIASRDGFVSWARSSVPAYKSGIFIKTRNVPAVELPSALVASQENMIKNESIRKEHDDSILFEEAFIEESFYSETYEKTYSILYFDDTPSPRPIGC